MQPAVELHHVTKLFGSRSRAPVRAVNDVSLTIPHGSVVAFLGPNGAGKTTTIDMMLGLVNPTQGKVQVLGQNPRDAVKAGMVSAVLQSGGLLRDLTVGETVHLIASTFANPVSTDTVLQRAGLADLTHRRVSKCSGGEQQRLRFALALLPDPQTLILDEPTTGMDVTARQEFWRTMHTEAREGRTVIFATHYLQEAENFAERIIMISQGHIVADGPTHEIRKQVAGRVVKATFPDPVSAQEILSPAASKITVAGNRLTIHTHDSDAMAGLVLANGGVDLEITTGSLDDAFTALT